MTPLRFSSRLPGILLALTLLLVLAPEAASTHNNRGTLKVHDNVEETPETRNVPHVACGFYLESFLLGDDSGWIRFFGWPPTGNMSEVNATGDSQVWTADFGSEGGGWHMLEGPYYLPAGHYRVEIHTDDGHPGSDAGHFAKSKTFWVEPCDETLASPPCPTVTRAEASATDGSNHVTLGWAPTPEADAYVVYRALELGEFEAVGDVGGDVTMFVDTGTVAGTTYEYYVTAVIDGVESEACAMVKVTAVPFFPSAIVGALVLVGAVGAYAALRRK